MIVLMVDFMGKSFCKLIFHPTKVVLLLLWSQNWYYY
jgi:hypothetical protein